MLKTSGWRGVYASNMTSGNRLAPSDIVARAIDHEMKSRGEDYVGLDCRHIDEEEFAERFPKDLSKVQKHWDRPWPKI
jgi:L-aspartate oxidase